MSNEVRYMKDQILELIRVLERQVNKERDTAPWPINSPVARAVRLERIRDFSAMAKELRKIIGAYPSDETVLCKHCGRPIEGLIHLEGLYRGKMRCDPSDSGLQYGYNAEPIGVQCKSPCLGANDDRNSGDHL